MGDVISWLELFPTGESCWRERAGVYSLQRHLQHLRNYFKFSHHTQKSVPYERCSDFSTLWYTRCHLVKISAWVLYTDQKCLVCCVCSHLLVWIPTGCQCWIGAGGGGHSEPHFSIKASASAGHHLSSECFSPHCLLVLIRSICPFLLPDTKPLITQEMVQSLTAWGQEFGKV